MVKRRGLCRRKRWRHHSAEFHAIGLGHGIREIRINEKGTLLRA
jgi:hypothetical protein